MQDQLDIDFETSSRVDLTKAGLDVYARHHSTKVLMMAWQFNDGPVEVWQPHLGPMPETLRRKIMDPKVRKVAHNAQFEIAIFNHVLNMPTPASEWHCTQVMALSLSLPGKLAILVRDALRLDRKYWKDAEGDRLMRLFSYPNHKAYWNTHPKEWAAYVEYCRQDVVAESRVYKVLKPYIPYMTRLFREWTLDQKINARGWPVDVEFATTALDIVDTVKARYLEQAKELTGLAKPNAWQQLLPWAQKRGYPFSSMGKDRIKVALRDFDFEMDNLLIKVLKLRLIANKTSLTKINAILRAAVDGRIRYILQFMGASRTGRWAGRVVQFQNLMRPTKAVEKFLADLRKMISESDLESIELFFGSPLEALASSIRSIIAAKPGKKLVVADLSAIELCVSTWLTGSKFWWKVLNDNLDPYKAFGEHLFRKPYAELTKQERNDSKPAVLGCWYRLGGGTVKGVYPDQHKTGLLGYAENMGIALTKEQSKAAVKIFRDLTPEAKIMWQDLENACVEAIKTREPQRVGPLVIDIRSPFLRIRLPSGRFLYYCRPKVEMVTVTFVDEDTGEERSWTKESMTFEQWVEKANKWMRISSHGGLTFENIVQAIARDVLQDGLENADEAGFDLFGHVHDEAAAEVDDDPFGLGLDDLIACLTARRGWSETMPLKAAGYENHFYKKD